jgi:hypothetical protein
MEFLERHRLPGDEDSAFALRHGENLTLIPYLQEETLNGVQPRGTFTKDANKSE